MKTSLGIVVLVIMLVVPVFAFADHNSPHTITQIQAQIVAIQAQLKALQSTSPSQEAVEVQVPMTHQSTIPELSPTIVPPVFDDDTSDDDIVQLNNLRIQSISSPNLPAIIHATYDSGARCLRYESESSAKGLSIPCPVSPSYLYQIRVDQHTVLLLRNRGRGGISQFEAGDRINVYGFKDRDTGAVDALIVRNLDKPLAKRFIQLNNVEVTQAAYPPTPPATVVVIQKGVSPCFEFGEHGSGSGSAFPCPLGLEVSEESVPNQAKSIASSLYYPRPRQYFIDVNLQTKIIQRDRNPMLLKDIQVGDVLNIYGVERQDKKTIEALTIRDISIPKVISTGTLQIIVSDAEFSGVLYDATVEAYNDQAVLVGKKQVGERGSVIFESLQLGKYTIVVSAPGYQSRKQQIVVDKPGKINAFTVTLLKEGGTISNFAPAVSGIKGPSTLNIGEVGTWTVSAYDPEQGPLSYNVVWGDEESRLNQPLAASSPTEAQQIATFTHSYAKAGVYDPTFIVTDNGGLSAKTSISVNVGEISVSQPIYEAEPSGTLVQNQFYTFKGSVRNALPYKPVYFYLRRPDGTMKYDDKNDILAKAENRSTDSTGYFSISAEQQIPNEGQTGTYISWVIIGGVASNKIYHTVVSSSSVAPSITVLSPNGGESWQLNSIQNVRWSTNPDIVEVFIELVRSTKDEGGWIIGTPPLPNNGIFSWKVGSGYSRVGDTELKPGSYFLVVRGRRASDPIGTYPIFGYSASPFSIVSATQPFIAIISPNGGENWQIGSTQTIKWSSSNVPTVMVDLIRPGYECHLTNGDVPNTGFLTFTVSNCVNGLSISSAVDYKIRVMYRSNAAVVVQDESDTPFSIIGGTVVVPTLNVALDASSPISTTFTAGAINVSFAKIKVTAGTEAVNNMNAIQIGSDSSNVGKTLSNFKVYDGATLLSSSSFDLDYNGSYYYKWLKVNGFSVPANTSKVLTVVADVKSTAPSGNVRLGIAGWNFDAPGAHVQPFGTPLYGNQMVITAPIFYPGFFMKTDKSLYSLNDTVLLTLSRADNRTEPYAVDLYAMNSGGSDKVLISSNLQVGQNTVTKIQLNQWPLFTKGGTGQYLFATCPAGCTYGSDQNTNSVVIELSTVQGSLTMKKNLADVLEAMRLQLAAMTEVVKKLSR